MITNSALDRLAEIVPDPNAVATYKVGVDDGDNPFVATVEMTGAEFLLHSLRLARELIRVPSRHPSRSDILEDPQFYIPSFAHAQIERTLIWNLGDSDITSPFAAISVENKSVLFATAEITEGPETMTGRAKALVITEDEIAEHIEHIKARLYALNQE